MIKTFKNMKSSTQRTCIIQQKECLFFFQISWPLPYFKIMRNSKSKETWMHSLIYDYLASTNYLKWSKSLILHLGHSTQWLTVALIQRRGCMLFDSFFLTGLQCPVVIILDAVWFHSFEAILGSLAGWHIMLVTTK